MRGLPSPIASIRWPMSRTRTAPRRPGRASGPDRSSCPGTTDATDCERIGCRDRYHRPWRSDADGSRVGVLGIAQRPRRTAPIEPPLGKEPLMRRLALVLLCLIATPAMAISDKPYITAADVDFPGLLPPPPKEDTAE